MFEIWHGVDWAELGWNFWVWWLVSGPLEVALWDVLAFGAKRLGKAWQTSVFALKRNDGWHFSWFLVRWKDFWVECGMARLLESWEVALFGYFSVFGAKFSFDWARWFVWNPEILKYVGNSWVLEIIVAKKWWNFDLFFSKFWHFAFISKISGNVTEISYFLGFLGLFREFLGYVGKKVRKIAIFSSKFSATSQLSLRKCIKKSRIFFEKTLKISIFW